MRTIAREALQKWQESKRPKWHEVPGAHRHAGEVTRVIGLPFGVLVHVIVDWGSDTEAGPMPHAASGLSYVPGATLADFGIDAQPAKTGGRGMREMVAMRIIAREYLDHLDDLLRDARHELSEHDPHDIATVDKLCAHLQAASGVIGSAAHDRARDARQAADALRWDEVELAMDDVSALCQETEDAP